MTSRIIHDRTYNKNPSETYDDWVDKVTNTAKKHLKIRLAGQSEKTKQFALESLEGLVPYLVQKVCPESTDRYMHQIDRDIGIFNEKQFELLEKDIGTNQAVSVMAKVIAAAISATREVIEVNVSVPHAGRLAKLFDAGRQRRHLEWASGRG